MSMKDIMQCVRFDSGADGQLVVGNSFCLMINVVFCMGFSKISGLTLEMEMETIQEGGTNTYCHDLPKPMSKSQRLTLEKGYGTRNILAAPLFSPFINPFEYSYVRFAGELIVFNRNGNPIRMVSFRNATITKIELGDLDASSNNVIVQKMEIVHNGLYDVDLSLISSLF